MSPSPEAVKHQARRAATANTTAKPAGKLWQSVDQHNIAADWQRKLAKVIALVSAGQLAAARDADPYLARVLSGVESEHRLKPSALSGISSDGRPLGGLLMYPVWTTLSYITQGNSVAQSLAMGGSLLDLLVRTLVADAGRAADLVGMIARPAVTSYVRVVELPACDRCIVLAGREYGISSGFQRHPRCDCTMEPVTRKHKPAPTSPLSVFRQMTTTQRIQRFGPEAVEAIDAGADIAQVVNARRGMGTATHYGQAIQATTEGTTKRGLARQRMGRASVRLMPEEIIKRADDRDDAIRLLKKYGYVY